MYFRSLKYYDCAILVLHISIVQFWSRDLVCGKQGTSPTVRMFRSNTWEGIMGAGCISSRGMVVLATSPLPSPMCAHTKCSLWIMIAGFGPPSFQLRDLIPWVSQLCNFYPLGMSVITIKSLSIVSFLTQKTYTTHGLVDVGSGHL